MDAMPQVPLGHSNLYLNPEPRCPVKLVLDRSYSTHGAKIDQLNAGLQSFMSSVSRDALCVKRLDMGITIYGNGVTVAQPFTTIDRISMPPLTAEGDTPMGEAIMTSLQLLEDRKAEYRRAGVPYFRGIVFHITDGAPTDDITAAQREIHKGEAAKKFMFFNVGVDTADMALLNKLAPRPALHLNGLAFGPMFQGLSHSVKAISRSTPGTSVPLTNPTGPGGWATVSV